jgi:hypothetical protein
VWSALPLRQRIAGGIPKASRASNMHHRRKDHNRSSPSTTMSAKDLLRMLKFPPPFKLAVPARRDARAFGLFGTPARSAGAIQDAGARLPRPATALAPRGDRAAAAHPRPPGRPSRSGPCA